MSYFKEVKVNDEIFGLVFGHGVVTSVWDDSFYTFEVTYDNGQVVPYTPEGYPAWRNLGHQTAFFKEDIDLEDLDFRINDGDVLSTKKIIKLRMKNKLEVKCPSGIWQAVGNCPSYVTEGYLEEGKLHLFRKAK